MCLYRTDVLPALLLFATCVAQGVLSCRRRDWRWVIALEEQANIPAIIGWPMVAACIAGTWKLLHDWMVRPDGPGWCPSLIGLFAMSLLPAAPVIVGLMVEARLPATGAQDEPWTWRDLGTRGLVGSLLVVAGFAIFGR